MEEKTTILISISRGWGWGVGFANDFVILDTSFATIIAYIVIMLGFIISYGRVDLNFKFSCG